MIPDQEPTTVHRPPAPRDQRGASGAIDGINGVWTAQNLPKNPVMSKYTFPCSPESVVKSIASYMCPPPLRSAWLPRV